MPTVRQLAGDLCVAPNTVARAYAELQAQGWVTCEGRRGTRVAADPPTRGDASRAQRLNEAIQHFLATLAQRGFTEDEVASALKQFTMR